MEEFRFKKSLGQNFLIDKNIIKNITDNLDVKEGDLIVEIGAGSGALTKKLKEKKANILAFEIDKRLEAQLKNITDDKTKIVYEDFLRIEINEVIKKYKFNNLYFVGNLPYYITTPIINKITKSKLNLKQMVFMVQKEVGERFTASPKTKAYSSITVFLNYNYEIQKLMIVSKECFIPKPKVDSVVLKFTKRNYHVRPKNEAFFEEIVKESFKYKRKTLKNNLKNYNIEKMFKDLNLKDSIRAEELTIEEFIKISDYLC